MSKLAELIAIKLAGRSVYYSQNPLLTDFTTVTSTTMQEPVNHVTNYTVGVNLGCRISVTDAQIMANDRVLEYAKDDAVRAIIESVFGEFRPLLSQLRIALRRNETDIALDILNMLEHEMFEPQLIK